MWCTSLKEGIRRVHHKLLLERYAEKVPSELKLRSELGRLD